MRVTVNSREIAAEYRLNHWAQIMQERSESGMSIKAYCESIGLHQNVYHYWQRKLREAAITVTNAQKETGTELAAQVPQGWALCETEKLQSAQGQIEIKIGKSCVIVNADTSQELLSKVCRTLMSLC